MHWEDEPTRVRRVTRLRRVADDVDFELPATYEPNAPRALLDVEIEPTEAALLDG